MSDKWKRRDRKCMTTDCPKCRACAHEILWTKTREGEYWPYDMRNGWCCPNCGPWVTPPVKVEPIFLEEFSEENLETI